MEEELGVRVPGVGPGRLHEGESRKRCADRALLDQAQCRLLAGSQEGIGCSSDVQAEPGGLAEQRLAALAVECERLLGPDVLARGERLKGDLDVSGGDGQVDHDLDLGVREQFLDRSVAGDAVLLRLSLGAYQVDVGDEDYFEIGEGRQVVEVLAADDAGTDDADADATGAAHAETPFAVRYAKLSASASKTSPLQPSSSTTRSACGAAARMPRMSTLPAPTATWSWSS